MCFYRITPVVRFTLILLSAVLSGATVFAENTANPSVSIPERPTASPAAPPTPRAAPRPAGKIYYVIPLEGEVGIAMTTEVIAASLKHAEEIKPEVIVMEINSPGGYVAEMIPIFDLMIGWQTKNPSIRVVALVREQAFSAAAMIAMTIKDIYMMPGSAIGAAMVINTSSTGQVSRVNEKFESAVRAKARTAAEFGGHNPAIVEAMIDPSLSLWLTRDVRGRPVVYSSADARIRNTDSRSPPVMIDTPQKLLTLTPKEALNCGLIAGIVDGYPQLMEELGLPNAVEFDSFARDAVKEHNRKIEKIGTEFERLVSLIKKLDAVGTMRTLADIEAFRGKLNAVKASINRIEKMTGEHKFLKEFVESKYGMTFDAVKVAVDKGMAEMESISREVRARRTR